MSAVVGRVISVIVASIPLAFGVTMLLSPVRFSRFLYWLAAPQRELLRGGTLFDTYWPERVELSHSLRTQIRLLGVIFLAVGVMIARSG
jgi:hypothetical protein